MRRDEAISAAKVAGAGLGGLTTLVQRAHDGIQPQVYDVLGRALGPVVTPIRSTHDAIGATVFGTVRAGLSLGTKAATAVAASGDPGGSPLADGTAAANTLAIVQGFFGDRFADEPVAFRTSLRAGGTDVPPNAEALRAAYPMARGRIVVFLHGLMELDRTWSYKSQQWHGDTETTLGQVIEQQLPMTAVYLRYNTGIRISRNGVHVAALLQELVANWPVPVEEVVLIGHSMGGLVALSALHQFPEAEWAQLVKRTVTLGAPHRGSGVERAAATLAHRVDRIPHAHWLAHLIRARSGGIRDLAHGNLFEQDWLDRPADTRDNHREVLHLPPGIHHARIVATMAPPAVLGLLGDGLVSVASALAGETAADEQVGIVQRAHHFDLLNHPQVHEHVLEWLREDHPVGGNP